MSRSSTPRATLAVLGFAPFIIPLVAALVLRARWNSIPPRFAVRWAADGSAVGFATRSFWPVYGWPLAAAILVIGLSAQNLAVLFWLNPADPSSVRLRARVFAAGVVAATFVAAILTAAGFLPLIHSGFPISWIVLAPLVTVAGILAALWILAPARLSAAAAPTRFSAGSTRAPVLLEKTVGLGFAYNLANPRAWLLLTLLAASVVTALLVLLRAAR